MGYQFFITVAVRKNIFQRKAEYFFFSGKRNVPPLKRVYKMADFFYA